VPNFSNLAATERQPFTFNEPITFMQWL